MSGRLVRESLQMINVVGQHLGQELLNNAEPSQEVVQELQKFQQMKDAAQNAEQAAVYKLLIDYLDLNLGNNRYKGMSPQKMYAAIVKDSGAILSQFVHHAARHADQMRPEDKAVIVENLGSFLGVRTAVAQETGADGATALNDKFKKELLEGLSPRAVEAFFQTVHLYGMEQIFQTGMQGHFVPWKMQKAYKLWSGGPQAGAASPPKPQNAEVPPPDQSLVTQRRNAVAMIRSQVSHPLQQAYYDSLLRYADLILSEAAVNLDVMKPRQKEREQDARVKRSAAAVGDLIHHAVAGFDAFGPQEKGSVISNFEVYLGVLRPEDELVKRQSPAEQQANIAMRRRVLDHLTPQAMHGLFELVHKFEMVTLFKTAIEENRLPVRYAKLYARWLQQREMQSAAGQAGPMDQAAVDRVYDEVERVVRTRLEELKALEAQSDNPVQLRFYGNLKRLASLSQGLSEGRVTPDKMMTDCASLYGAVTHIVSRDFHALSEREHNQAKHILTAILGDIPLNTVMTQGIGAAELQRQAMQQSREVMSRMGPEASINLFRSLYHLGLEGHFAKAVELGFVPKKIIGAHKQWRDQNSQWIADKSWLNPPQVVRPMAPPVVTLPPDAVLQKHVETLAVAETHPVVMIDLAKAAEVAPVMLNVPDRVAIRDAVEIVPVEEIVLDVTVDPEPVPVAGPEEAPSAVAYPSWDDVKRARRAAKKGGSRFAGWNFDKPAAPIIVRAAAPAGPNPDELDWEELERLTAPAAVDEPADVVPDITPEVVVVVPAAPKTEDILEGLEDTSIVMPVVKVHLNVISDDEDMRDNLPSKGGKRAVCKHKDMHGLQDDTHDRTGLLLPALAHDDKPGKMLYPYVQPVDPNAEKKERLYNVIDVEFPQREGGAERAQVFVCNFHGYATFIKRGTTEAFDPADEINIGAMRDDPLVWMVPFISDEQWVKDIQERLYTPVNQMDVQMKRNHFWLNRAEALEETFIRHVVQKGCKPSPHETSIIQDGELAGQATWCAAAAAMRRGTVGGLEHIHTVSALLAHAAEKYPALLKFVRTEPLAVAASDLAGYCRRMKKTLADATEIGPWRKDVLELAFRYGAVKGVEAVVPAGHNAPKTLDEFHEMVRRPAKPMPL